MFLAEQNYNHVLVRLSYIVTKLKSNVNLLLQLLSLSVHVSVGLLLCGQCGNGYQLFLDHKVSTLYVNYF